MRLAAKDIKQMAMFAAVGVVNTAVDFAVFSVLVFQFAWNLIVSNSIAFCSAVVVSYVLNAFWTFRATKSTAGPFANLGRFFSVSLVGLGISNLLVWLLAGTLGPIGAKLAAVIGTFIWNYGASRKFVFTAKN